MKNVIFLRQVALCGLMMGATLALSAQPGPRDHEKRDGGPGNGHDPQARNSQPGPRDSHPSGPEQHYFRTQDRDRFSGYYRHDFNRWNKRQRPVFVPGQVFARGYTIRPVPPSLRVNVEVPLPPGFQYGYYGGYVVAYNPRTRIVADVIDLIDAVR